MSDTMVQLLFFLLFLTPRSCSGLGEVRENTISHLHFTNLSTGTQTPQTCRCSWKCCICCPWRWAGKPGQCGDSLRQRCHCRARRVRCLHCRGTSWSFPGDPHRAPWPQSVLRPHPADRGFPGAVGRQGWMLSTGCQRPTLLSVPQEGWDDQNIFFAWWAFSDFLEVEKLPRTQHRYSTMLQRIWRETEIWAMGHIYYDGCLHSFPSTHSLQVFVGSQTSLSKCLPCGIAVTFSHEWREHRVAYDPKYYLFHLLACLGKEWESGSKWHKYIKTLHTKVKELEPGSTRESRTRKRIFSGQLRWRQLLPLKTKFSCRLAGGKGKRETLFLKLLLC